VTKGTGDQTILTCEFGVRIYPSLKTVEKRTKYNWVGGIRTEARPGGMDLGQRHCLGTKGRQEPGVFAWGFYNCVELKKNGGDDAKKQTFRMVCKPGEGGVWAKKNRRKTEVYLGSFGK